jgi:hypothetical protein
MERVGGMPGHHEEDRVRLENAGAGDGRIQVARQGLVLDVFRRSGIDRRQEVTADHVHPESPGLVAGDELLDVLARAEDENALRGDQSEPAADHRHPDEQVSQAEQGADGRAVEGQHPAARIDDTDLRQEAQRQQADERHVPEPDRAAQVLIEAEEIREPVFSAE